MAPHQVTLRQEASPAGPGSARPELRLAGGTVARAADLDLHPSAEVYERLGRNVAARPFQLTKLLIASLDTVAVLLSLYLARVIAGGRLSNGGQPSSFSLAACTLPIWAMALAQQSLYKSRRLSRGVDESVRIIRAVLSAVGGTAVLSVIAGVALSRMWLTLVLVFGIALLVTERFGLRLWFRRARREGRMMRQVMILGNNAEGRAVHDNLATDPSLGYEVIGFIEDHVGDRPVSPEIALQHLRAGGAQGVIIAATAVIFASSLKRAKTGNSRA